MSIVVVVVVERRDAFCLWVHFDVAQDERDTGRRCFLALVVFAERRRSGDRGRGGRGRVGAARRTHFVRVIVQRI